MGFLAQLGALISIAFGSVFGHFVSLPTPAATQQQDRGSLAQTYTIPGATSQKTTSSNTSSSNDNTTQGTLIPILSAQVKSGGYGVEEYYKDSKHVYIAGYEETPRIIPGADPETFTPDVKTLSSTSNYSLAFALDKDHIYYYGRPTNLSPKGFLLLDAGSTKDCGWDPIVQDVVDDKTEFFTDTTHDANYSMISFTQIQNVDPTTFEIVARGYSKDKNHVYVGASTTSADPTMFTANMAVRCPGGF